MSSSILLRNGTAIVHDSNDNPVETKCDVLITGSTITEISPSITPPSSTTEIIDCTNKIVSPGFVDTHRHLWQTALRGTHADHTLLDYFAPGNFTASLYNPDDVYWGQLAGALEALGAGTTTLLDHSHINYSPAHVRAAIKASKDSGLRTIYGYTVTPRVKSWSPGFEVDSDWLADWVMSTFAELAASRPLAPNDRVVLGFAFDGLIYMPPDAAKDVLQRVYDAGTRVLTMHGNGGPMWGSEPQPSMFETLANMGLLPLPSKTDGTDQMHLVGSHMCYLPDTPSVRELLSKYAPTLSISTTPSTELNMSLTPCHALQPGLKPFASLGVDCQSFCPASMTGQMRLLLAHARSTRDAQLTTKGKWASEVGNDLGVKDAFNVATVGGARAVGMNADIGRLRVGAKADVLVISCDGPGMLGIGEGDALAGVVGHSEPSDIEYVIVDGIVRKRAGKLVFENVEVDGEQLTWETVVKKLRASSQRIRKDRTKLDYAGARESITETFHMDMANAIGGDGQAVEVSK